MEISEKLESVDYFGINVLDGTDYYSEENFNVNGYVQIDIIRDLGI